jgi:hypothetical protein
MTTFEDDLVFNDQFEVPSVRPRGGNLCMLEIPGEGCIPYDKRISRSAKSSRVTVAVGCVNE